MLRGGSQKDVPLNPPNPCFSETISLYPAGGEAGGAGVEMLGCCSVSGERSEGLFKAKRVLGWSAGRSASAQLPVGSVFPFSPGSGPRDLSALF